MEPLREERLFARLHLEKEAAYVECYSVSRALGGKCRQLNIGFILINLQPGHDHYSRTVSYETYHSR
jgi:hypothetical protein